MKNRFWDTKKEVVKLKICNVQSLEMACILNELGVDSIGIHYWEKNNSKKTIENLEWIKGLQGKEISKWVLTDCYELNTLKSILIDLPFDTIQFQGSIDSQKISYISKELKSIYSELKIVKTVSSNLANNKQSEDYVRSLNSCCDGILFDTEWRGGTGVENNLAGSFMLSHWCTKEIIIAGGINIENIHTVINKLKPNAVDIQSGVEELIEFGEGKKLRVKSIVKIENIIKALQRQDE